jgi:biopolymer transport protein TolR
MAMLGPKANAAEINVTPLIDVLLVLIIIFMVIQPVQQHRFGLEAQVPQPPVKSEAVPPDRTVVVQVLERAGERPALRINQDDVSWEQLPARLHEIYVRRAEKIMFVRGDDGVEFDPVAQVIDIAHGAGVEKVGLITARMMSQAGG